MGVHYGYFSPLRNAVIYRDFTKYQSINHGAGQNQLIYTRDNSSSSFYDQNGIIKFVSNNIPRFQYAQNAGSFLGLLIEGSRTNFIRNSEDLTSNFWLQQNSVEVANLFGDNLRLSPDGVTFSSFLRFPTGTLARISQLLSPPNSSNILTFSIWMKSTTGSNQSVILSIRDASTDSNYNSQTFTVTNAWNRFSISADCTTNSNGVRAIIDHNNTSLPEWNILVWGGQLEIGSFSSSYIRTTSSFTNRPEDLLKIADAQSFLNLYNEEEGTIFAEWSYYNGSGEPAIFEANFNQNYLGISQDFTTDGRRYSSTTLNNTTIKVSGGNTPEVLSAGRILRSAFAYKDLDSAFVRDQVIFNDTSTSYPKDLNSFVIGKSMRTGANYFGHLRKIAYIPYRVKDADLLRICK